MGRIFAIGGGEIGRPEPETLEIDRQLVALSKKEYPNFIFIPTASNDSDSYEEQRCG